MWRWVRRLVVSILVLTTMIALVAWLNEVELSYPGNRLLSTEVTELVVFNEGIGYYVGTNGQSIVLVRIEEISRSLDQIAFPAADFFPGTGYAYFEMPAESMPSLGQSVIDCAAYHVVSMEHWFIAICSAIYPIIFFIRSYRCRRARRGVLQPCVQCGYDLQGNQSGVCPECGLAREVTA